MDGITSYQTFRPEFSRQISVASHRQLKDMMKELRAVTHKRYVGGRPAKNEHIEHGFTEEEFMRFLSFVKEPEFEIAFLFIGLLGLRPNELMRMKGRDIIDGRLLIPSSKGGYELDLALPEQLLSLLPEAGEDERLFFRRWTAKTALRNLGEVFRDTRARSGLTEVYGYSNPGGRNGKQRRKLDRFSIKSLRHTGGQLLVEATNGDFDLQRRLLRQRNFKTTMVYSRKERKAKLEAGVAAVCESLFRDEHVMEVRAWTNRQYGNI